MSVAGAPRRRPLRAGVLDLTDTPKRTASGLGTLTTLLYDELRAAARRLLGGEGAGHTLQPTAIVNEVYLKLAAGQREQWESQTHFLAAAAQGVRHVLIDHARARRRLKRGGPAARRLSLDSTIIGGAEREIDALELEDALQRLEAGDPRAASIVELRFFGGLTTEQAASHLGLSTATVQRDWRFARAWLYEQLVGIELEPEAGRHG